MLLERPDGTMHDAVTTPAWPGPWAQCISSCCKPYSGLLDLIPFVRMIIATLLKSADSLHSIDHLWVHLGTDGVCLIFSKHRFSAILEVGFGSSVAQQTLGILLLSRDLASPCFVFLFRTGGEK